MVGVSVVPSVGEKDWRWVALVAAMLAVTLGIYSAYELENQRVDVLVAKLV